MPVQGRLLPLRTPVRPHFALRSLPERRDGCLPAAVTADGAATQGSGEGVFLRKVACEIADRDSHPARTHEAVEWLVDKYLQLLVNLVGQILPECPLAGGRIV